MSKQVKVTTIPLCDICEFTHNPPTQAYADANIPGVGWVSVCKMHFVNLGCKLGTGLGQELIVEEIEIGPSRAEPGDPSQEERIRAKLAGINPMNMTMEDFEDIFEDRDPSEFL